MLLDQVRPHAFREYRVAPEQAETAAQRQRDKVVARSRRAAALEAWAVHLAKDLTRVVVVEAWRDAESFRRDPDAREPGAALYAWAGTGGREPTPVEDAHAGVIVIDIFAVWRPLVRPVSAFNLRNGEAFNRQPGCISTTVLRGVGTGRIATYARWRTIDDFLAAFRAVTGKPVASADDINAAAVSMSFGIVRPDYHAYDLFAFKGDV